MNGYGGNGGRDEGDERNRSRGDDDRDDERGSDQMRDAIAQRLKRDPNYDFTALAEYLRRNAGGGYGAMSAQQIARRWSQVQDCVASLATMDDCGEGHSGQGGHGGQGWPRPDGGSGHGLASGGWGHSASTGRSQGYGGMDTLSGLDEGFRRL